MNRKNAIQSCLYIFAIIVIVGLLTWQAEQIEGLEETLHEHKETLSVTTTALQDTESTVKVLSAELSTTNAKLEESTTLVSELTVANEKLKQEKQKLQGDYDTLKKNKAIAAEKAKQQSSSQPTNTVGKNKEIVVSRSNNQTATKTFYVKATAYTAYCAGCSGITATGINLRANPDLKVIAVDPRVIPLGSKVWVEGYGYAIAGDTGGAIKGNKVDLFMPSKTDAYAWGRRTVQIKVF